MGDGGSLRLTGGGNDHKGVCTSSELADEHKNWLADGATMSRVPRGARDYGHDEKGWASRTPSSEVRSLSEDIMREDTLNHREDGHDKAHL